MSYCNLSGSSQTNVSGDPCKPLPEAKVKHLVVIPNVCKGWKGALKGFCKYDFQPLLNHAGFSN